MILLIIMMMQYLLMQNLYQGGSCNPNMLSTSNQYQRAMNNLTMGSQNPQRVIQMAQTGKSFQQQIQNRQMMFKAMNQNWGQAKQDHMQNNMQMNQMMQAQYQQSMLQHQQIMMMQQMQWQKSQQERMIQQMKLQQQFEQISIENQANKWANELKMQQGFKQATISYQQQQQNILNSSNSMLETMMNDPDPRFQNSQFLHFLGRIQKGQLVITGKQITQVKPDTQMMQNAWNEAQLIHKSNMATLDPAYQAAKQKQIQQTIKAQQLLQDNWAQKLKKYQQEYGNQEQFEKMLQQKYMSVLQQMNFDLTEAWQASTDLEQQLVHGQIKPQYLFQENNPYRQVAFPKKLAFQLINAGNNNQAILALQAHLQKNMQDGDTWRVLGRILQQNDQDQKSIPCFTNCLKYNPNNLDTLLSLGVSCTNILDEVKAMNYLKKWIMLNPKYQMKGIDNIIPDQMANLPTYKVQQIKMINDQMIKVFDKAVQINPQDPQLLSGLAILFFIKRQYQVSIDLFNRALNLDPTNYSLMNKVGATLAHLGRADQAIKFYHRALDIRPNYVRVWVNLGIAHAFKGLYNQAASFYLNALSFRPDAKHIWSYLHTSFLALQRYDLLGKISSQNPHMFDQFDVINLNDLPQPQITYGLTTQKHILNRDASIWLSQFQDK